MGGALFGVERLTGDAGEAVVKKLNGYSGKLSGDAVTFSTALGDDGRAAVEAEES